MIDWSRVSELHEQVGSDDFAEVVELFLEEVQDTMRQLRQNTDVAALEAQLHFLKGCALNLGFSQFASRCQQGEFLAANEHGDQVDVTAILQSFDSSLIEFQRELPQRFAA
mgnify:CR=1 FL=1